MAVNFQNLLSKPADSVKRPTAKPPGTYFGTVKDFTFAESQKKKTPYVRFNVQNITPGEDVDMNLMVDAEGAPLDLSKWTPYRDFYLTDDSLYRLKDMIESCKIETKGRTFQEMIPELKGKPVMLTVTQRPSEDGETLYNDITDMKGAE